VWRVCISVRVDQIQRKMQIVQEEICRGKGRVAITLLARTGETEKKKHSNLEKKKRRGRNLLRSSELEAEEREDGTDHPPKPKLHLGGNQRQKRSDNKCSKKKNWGTSTRQGRKRRG